MTDEMLRSRIAQLEQEKATLQAEHRSCLDGDTAWAEKWREKYETTEAALRTEQAIHEQEQENYSASWERERALRNTAEDALDLTRAALAETREALQLLRERNVKVDQLVELALQMAGTDDVNSDDYALMTALAKSLGYEQ